MTHSLPNQHNLFRIQEPQVTIPLDPPVERQEAPIEISGKQKQKPSMRIELTLRDIHVFEQFHVGRYYTVAQLNALSWRQSDGTMPTSPRAAQHRIHRLSEAGFLRVVEQWVKKGQGAMPNIYALDRLGALIVSQELGIDYARIDWKPKALEGNYIFLQHLLETHNLRIALTLSAEKHGMKLSSWLYENTLRGKEYTDHVLLRDSQGKEARVAVIPDSFCVLETPRGIGYFPIEIDRGTVTLARWHQKIQAYLTYHTNGDYQKRYDARNFRLLTLTTGLPRLMNLKEQCEQVAPKDERFWFTTFDQVMTKVSMPYNRPGSTKPKVSYTYVYNDDLLTAPVWYRAGSDQLHTILE